MKVSYEKLGAHEHLGRVVDLEDFLRHEFSKDNAVDLLARLVTCLAEKGVIDLMDVQVIAGFNDNISVLNRAPSE